MAGLIDILLGMGQQTSSNPYRDAPTYVPGYGDSGSDENIAVMAPPKKVVREGEGLPPLGNRSAVEELMEARANRPQRKGVFGVKGTLRDIIGGLGDVLAQGDGVYFPGKREQAISDAMAGFTLDPIAAAERVAYEDAPMGRQLYKDYQDQQYRTSVADRQQSNVDRQYAKDAQAVKIQQVKLAQAMMAAARNPQEQEMVKAWYRDPTGDLSALPPHLIAAGGINPYQQAQLPIQQQRADADTTRANRPPAARAQPNPTNATIAAPLLEKLKQGGELTKGEAAVLQRMGYGEQSKGRPSTSTRRSRAGGSGVDLKGWKRVETGVPLAQ